MMYGTCFTEQFAVPFLLALSKDAVWSVRKTSCDVFVDVAMNCTMETKYRKLTPCFISLLKDSSRWVAHTAYKELGAFIATFADTSHSELKLRNGRLVSVNNEMVEGIDDTVDRKDDNKISINDDESNFYHQLPPGVEFPNIYATNCGHYSPSVSLTVEDDRHISNKMRSLLDSWALSNSYSEPQVSSDNNFFHGAKTTLRKQENVNIANGEEACYMYVNDENDINVCFKESSQTNIGDNVDAYCSLQYWSLGYVDIDLTSYKTEANVDCVSNSNGRNKSHIEQLIDKFIRRRSSLFVDTSEQLYSNVHEKAVSDGKLEKHCENIVEKEIVDRLNSFSDKVNKSTPTTAKSYSGRNNGNELVTSASVTVVAQMVIPQPLLDSFIQMVRPANADDADINQQCARSFPAVAFTLGRRNWSCIVGTYKQLSSDMQWRVRHALASSIHEIAAIIGEENADVHLAPVFEQFMKDIGSLVTPATRQKLLSVLPNFLHPDTSNERNWRNRYEYIRQCILLCDLFNIHDINEYLVAIALTLANDRISDVRKEATKLLAKILGKLVKKEWILDCFDSSATDVSSLPVTKSFISDIVKGFSRSMNWRRRQTFALFCQQSLEGGLLTYDQFSFLLLDDLIPLARDLVANVRLAFARSLSKTCGGLAFHDLRDSSIVRSSLELLLSDRDAECRRIARVSLGIADNEGDVDAKKYAQQIRKIEEIISVKYRNTHIVPSE